MMQGSAAPESGVETEEPLLAICERASNQASDEEADCCLDAM